MKKILILFFVLILVTGCGSSGDSKDDTIYNESKDKLISVLEYVGFTCDMDVNICSKDVTDNSNGLYSYEVNFNNTTYSSTFSVVEYVNGVRQTSSIKDKYNWKTDYAESDATMEGYYNDSVYVIIDETGDYSCMSQDNNKCDALKAGLMSTKKTFLDYVSTANIELEDIK